MKLILSAEEIQQHVRRLGRELSEAVRGEDVGEILIVGILNGAAMFVADLSRQFPPCYVDFWQLSSYGNVQTSRGKVHSRNHLQVSPHNRHVILVDTIADSGKTMMWAQSEIVKCHPRSVRTVALLKRRDCKYLINHVGKVIDHDTFLIGYGLDDQQGVRNLPGIFSLVD